MAAAGIAALNSPPALAAAPAHKPARTICCRAPSGTVVHVALAEPISTNSVMPGDTFALRLSEPLVINGRIVLKAGTRGVGEVIEAAKPGLGGKSAKLVLAARYLVVGRRHILLQGMQMEGVGRDNSLAANAVGLTGIAFMPLGFIALAVHGGDVTLPSGQEATAKLSHDVILTSLGRAPASAITAAEAPEAADEAIAIPAPPPGEGQVVFFRPKSLLGTGQWFNVREDGKALGKLTNGAYFIQVVHPGDHTYTAKTEPAFNDKLKLEIDPGETYFVEGALTKGLVIGAADLIPSDRAAFEKSAKDLKPASSEQAATPAPSPVPGAAPDPAAASSTPAG
jgi:hypothetical protein